MTEWIEEPARRVPVVDEFDICVVGGSCTGVFAAVRAARLGARVAVVEKNGFFGGAATAGLVHVWHPLHDMARERQIIGGLTQEVVERLERRDAVMTPESPTVHAAFRLNTEELKIELDELVRENGIRAFLHTWFVAPVVEDGRLAAVVVEDKSGRRAIRARCFVDATGDGDVISRMGLPCHVGENLQPPTVVAIWDGFGEIRRQNEGFDLSGMVHDPTYPGALKQGFLWGAGIPNRPEAYMVAGTRAHHADCSDADQQTEAEMECRRQVRAMTDILRKHAKGGKGLALSSLSSCIGIRETRHAECLHALTQEEVLGGTRFDDAIANGTYPVDIHHSDRPGITLRYLDGTERYAEPGKEAELTRWRAESEGVTPFYQVPYRSLVPVGAENVLVAGRLIGADRGAYGAIRVMVNCNQTGEAAGEAAYLAVESDCAVADVDTAALRDRLTDGGSIVV